ncbi:MAG: primosomal protein N' [Terrimicrobiaceae bacterium]
MESLEGFFDQGSATRRVAVVVPDRAGDKALDYEIPEKLSEAVAPGSRVRIPIRTRVVLGTVVETFQEERDRRALRAIEGVLEGRPLIQPGLLELARWMAEYYCSSLESAMACVLPQAVRSGDVAAKELLHVRLIREVSPADVEKLERRAPRQADALRCLLESGRDGKIGAAWPLAKLASENGLPEAAFRSLAKAGWVEISSKEVGRDPFASETFVQSPDLVLNAEQSLALEKIRQAINSPATARPVLLHGVTGSGKTEVYLQAIRAALNGGRSALVLVPEISLTPQTVERFKTRFADRPGGVAVLHSHLSAGERRDEWHRIHRGQARIVIGARSAVFAPLQNPGIIIVDEEHESSYKQEEAPRYHARDVAVLRAAREGCAIVLGSATPSLESWRNVLIEKYELVELTQRVDDRKMPVLKVLDMRRSAGGDGIFSPALTMAIEGRLARGEQVILFLNRRGFSTSMQCPACGSVRQCPNCSVSLTYHRDEGRLACHICGHAEKAPKVCPECKDPAIRFHGVGTQKVEDAISRIFPQARIARMDADAMTRKDAYRETLGAFRKGEIDILVGTQMIAKGLDFPNVTLVGIINADTGLHLPDFRAGERTFQLLTQVAGRAGRGEVEGEVFIQTFTPFSPSIQFARHHDFRGFSEQELEFRSAFGFPPYYRMILITVRSQSHKKAEFCALTLAKKLRENLPAGAICGESAPAPLARAKSYHRFQVALRGPSARPLARHVRAVLDTLPLPEDVFATVDVDPMSLL